MSLAVLLPREADGLAALKRQLAAETLADWLAGLDTAPARQTEVYLPVFTLETGSDLVPPLQAMGMRAAFRGADQADFSGMGYAPGGVCISRIRHQAAVEVSEEGTEAAAATAVDMALTAAIEPRPVFRADHPFLFLIRESGTGSLLFMGRLAYPAGR